jgi:hypothetical protein
MMRAGLSLILLALLAQAQPADAVQLDKDECARLKTEQSQLESGGVRGTMVKGPEWAKTNLPPEKLEQVKRLIELDEQLLFRCGGRPLVVMPSEPDPDPAARGTEGEPPQVEPAALAPKPPAAAPAVLPAEKPPPAARKAAVPPAAAAPKDAPKPATAATRPAPPPIKAGTAPGTSAGGSAPPAPGKDDKAAAAKAKKKADDAYRPPSQDGSGNPFGQGSPRN